VAAPSPPSSVDDVLHVDHFGLSIGALSVGLPPSCTADDVLRRYLDLQRLVHRRDPGALRHPDDDVAALAARTGYPTEVVRRRLARLGCC
jgi:hypothetical protein